MRRFLQWLCCEDGERIVRVKRRSPLDGVASLGSRQVFPICQKMRSLNVRANTKV